MVPDRVSARDPHAHARLNPWSRPVTALKDLPGVAVAGVSRRVTMGLVNRVGRVSAQVSLRPGWVQERLITALVPDAVGARDDVVVPPLPVLPALGGGRRG